MALYEDDYANADHARFQELSDRYEPEPTGPLVGPRVPSTTLATEYANADPIYRVKTEALPRKYSYFRAIRGDGRCGWRAIAFGYYETLIKNCDKSKFIEEESRLRSLYEIFNGPDPSLSTYSDFADEFFELLQALRDRLDSIQDAETHLFATFNDEGITNYIITFLKILTAACLKQRAVEFQAYLVGLTVQEYCDRDVMPIMSEIDNVSLDALQSVFLAPAGIALEVIYLDRSQASEVNTHRFDSTNNHPIGTISLLYRPGHYDLLYQVQEETVAALQPVSAYFQFAGPVYHQPIYNSGVQDLLASIPGMSYAQPMYGWNQPQYGGAPTFATPVENQPFQPSGQINPGQNPISHGSAHEARPVGSHGPVQSLHLEDIASMTHSRTSRSDSATTLSPQTETGPFRKSAWELEPELLAATSQVPFQTSIFRNSHFNTAHFLNPEFQPEEWRPDDDYVTPGIPSGVFNANVDGQVDCAKPAR